MYIQQTQTHSRDCPQSGKEEKEIGGDCKTCNNDRDPAHMHCYREKLKQGTLLSDTVRKTSAAPETHQSDLCKFCNPTAPCIQNKPLQKGARPLVTERILSQDYLKTYPPRVVKGIPGYMWHVSMRPTIRPRYRTCWQPASSNDCQ